MTEEPRDEELEQAQDDAPAQEAEADAEGPDASELDQEPDYNPDDPGLKGLKGG